MRVNSQLNDLNSNNLNTYISIYLRSRPNYSNIYLKEAGGWANCSVAANRSNEVEPHVALPYKGHTGGSER